MRNCLFVCSCGYRKGETEKRVRENRVSLAVYRTDPLAVAVLTTFIAAHHSRPKPPPPRSEWSRYYKLSSDTGRPGRPRSRSEPNRHVKAQLNPVVRHNVTKVRDTAGISEWGYILQSVLLYGCSLRSWPRPMAFPPGLSSSGRSGQTYL